MHQFYSFLDFFFAAFAAIELKLNICLHNKLLQIKFEFQKIWPLFSRVMALEHRNFQQFYSFPDFFSQPLQLLNWNLIYAFIINNYRSSLSFRKIDPFLAELRPVNIEIFTNFTVFWTFFSAFSDIELKLGIHLYCNELQIQF